MELNEVIGKLFKVCEVISKMVYVNLLWILFTVLGLGILGIMPATVALFTVTRKWVMGNKDISVFNTFWITYRKEFFKSTLLGVILFVIGSIIYIDLVLLPTEGLSNLLRLGIFICAILFAIVLLYIFPVYVHYDRNKRLYMKYALLIGASHPHFTLLMVAGIIGLYYITITIPGIIPFFSVNVIAFIIMWPSYQIFKKIEVVQATGQKRVDAGQVVDAK
jgi:uncharacterized membrane protein YesL